MIRLSPCAGIRASNGGISRPFRVHGRQKGPWMNFSLVEGRDVL